jgi:hypothetical protein
MTEVSSSEETGKFLFILLLYFTALLIFRMADDLKSIRKEATIV